MATRLSACLCCCVLGSAALAQAPARKIRQKMADTLNSTPDFICSVSIERTERTGNGAPATLSPLQVNAGIINGKELYVLPSSDADQALLRRVLAVYKRAGTGSFGMYARAVFLTTEATFYIVPEETKDGRTLARLDFAMPREVSHYSLTSAGHHVDLGYSGSIWTDPRNQEVTRVLLQADDIPQDLGIKAVTQTVDYGRIAILGIPVLLPTATDLTLREVSGRELRITGHFAGCREFSPKRGDQYVENGLETAVAASAAAPAPVSAPLVSQVVPSIVELLPVKTFFEMMLEDPIDERSTVEGSKLSFTVSRDIKKGGKIVLPKGATATGHVTRILRQTYPFETGQKGYYLVGIQLETMDVGDRRFRMWANLERVGPPAAQIGFVPLSVDPNRFGEFDDRQTLFIVPAAEHGESFLGIVSEFLRLGGHWKTYWTIVKPPA
jgi:hypothetical protein